jgi:hypothetical protein
VINLPPCFSDSAAKKLLREICAEHKIDKDLLHELCEKVSEHAGKGRIDGIDDEMDQILDRFHERDSS